MAQPLQTDPQFKLRMPAELKGAIESAASKNNRSMNAEIVARLEQSFRESAQDPLSSKETLEMIVNKLEVLSTSSLDQVMNIYLKRFAKAPLVIGNVDRFTEQYDKEKKEEKSRIRRLIRLADSLLEEAYSRIGETPPKDD